jgi:hypothetical protein
MQVVDYRVLNHVYTVNFTQNRKKITCYTLIDTLNAHNRVPPGYTLSFKCDDRLHGNLQSKCEF